MAGAEQKEKALVTVSNEFFTSSDDFRLVAATHDDGHLLLLGEARGESGVGSHWPGRLPSLGAVHLILQLGLVALCKSDHLGLATENAG